MIFLSTFSNPRRIMNTENTIFKVPEWVQHFFRDPTFSRGGGGPNANFYRNL